jgi:hypothetical protein
MKMNTKKFSVGDVVARVRSKSNPRRVHKIRKAKDGLVCPCFGFRYAKGDVGSRTKRCRHFDEAGL